MSKSGASSRFRSSSSLSSSRNNMRSQEESLEDINDLSDFDLSDVSTIKVSENMVRSNAAAGAAPSVDGSIGAEGSAAGSTVALGGATPHVAQSNAAGAVRTDGFGGSSDVSQIPLPTMGIGAVRKPNTKPQDERPLPSQISTASDIDIPEITHSRGGGSKGTERRGGAGSRGNASPYGVGRGGNDSSSDFIPTIKRSGGDRPQVPPVEAQRPASPVVTNVAPAAGAIQHPRAAVAPNPLESVMTAQPIAFSQGDGALSPQAGSVGAAPTSSFFDQAQQNAANQPAADANSLESRVAQVRNQIFGDIDTNKRVHPPKPERKPLELQAEEIARRSKEIWGSSFGTDAKADAQLQSSEPVSTVVTTSPMPTAAGAPSAMGGAGTAMGGASMGAVGASEAVRQAALAAAAAASTSAVAADADNMVLRNPQGPSTLINGLAFDFNQSAESVNRRIEDVMRQNAPLPKPNAHSDGMSYTQRAFAALNRLNENSTRISGVSTALTNRHIDQEPTTNTLITSSPQGNSQKAPAPYTGSSALASLKDYHTATILSDNRGRLVSDELGHFTHESDLIKAAHTPTAAAFKNAADGNRSTAALSAFTSQSNTNTVIAKSNALPPLSSGPAGAGAGAAGAFNRPSLMGNTNITGNATQGPSSSGPTVDILSLSAPFEAPAVDTSSNLSAPSAPAAESSAAAQSSSDATSSRASTMSADELEKLRQADAASHSKLFTNGLSGASFITAQGTPKDPASASAPAAAASAASGLENKQDNKPSLDYDSLRAAAKSLDAELHAISSTIHRPSAESAQASSLVPESKSSVPAATSSTEIKDPFKTLLQESDRQSSSAGAGSAPAATKSEEKKNIFTMVQPEEPQKLVDIDTLADPKNQDKVHLNANALDEIVLPPPPPKEEKPTVEDKGPFNPLLNPLVLDPDSRKNPLSSPQHRDPGFTLSARDDESADNELPPLVVPKAPESSASTAAVPPLTAPEAAPQATAAASAPTAPAATSELSAPIPEVPAVAISNAARAAAAPAAAPTVAAPAATVAAAPEAEASTSASVAEGDASESDDEEWLDEEFEDADDSYELTPAQAMVHDYVERCHLNVGNCTYFAGRDIGNDVVARFNLGFDPFYRTLPQNQMMQELSAAQMQQLSQLETWQAAIIPLSIDSFVAYKIATVSATGMAMPASWENEERRYIGTMQCFNLEAINQATLRRTPVFITGSEIDALTLESLNLPSLALGHASNLGSLFQYLQDFMLQLRQNRGAQLTLSSEHLGLSCYVALPDGTLWDEVRARLQRFMGELNITCHVVDLHSPYSSINLCLLQNRALLLNKLYHLNEITDVRLQEAVVPKTPLATQDLLLSLENLAKLQLSPLLYTLASPAAALSRLVQACLVENPRNSIIFAGSRMQWQMLCALLSFSPSPEQELEASLQAGLPAGMAMLDGSNGKKALASYRTKFLEMPLTTSAEDIEKTLHHGLTMARLNGMDKFTLMVDTFALEQGLCAQLSSRLAHLCAEFNIGIMVWCSLEQKHLFEGNSLQTLEMSQGASNEIIFSTLDSSCHLHSFSTVQG